MTAAQQSETPRTDRIIALIDSAPEELFGMIHLSRDATWAHHSQQLERELAAQSARLEAVEGRTCAVCESHNIVRSRTSTTCKDCQTSTADHAQSAAALCDDLRARLAKAEAALAEAQKDSERYRWLRDVASGTPASAEFWPGIELRLSQSLDKLWCEELVSSGLDSAIDAAIAQGGGDAKCEHGKGLTDYCLPCGRVNGG